MLWFVYYIPFCYLPSYVCVCLLCFIIADTVIMWVVWCNNLNRDNDAEILMFHCINCGSTNHTNQKWSQEVLQIVRKILNHMQFFWLCCRIGKIGQAKENNEKLAHLTTCDLLVFFYVKTATSINDTHIITWMDVHLNNALPLLMCQLRPVNYVAKIFSNNFISL